VRGETGEILVPVAVVDGRGVCPSADIDTGLRLNIEPIKRRPNGFPDFGEFRFPVELYEGDSGDIS
jgi:hypothetical protein